MKRRQFILMCLTIVFPSVAYAGDRSFVFKIKTKSGSLVGNIVIKAKDMDAAKYKLRQRYPDCEIMEAREK